MPFCSSCHLPNEVIRLILIPAVQGRTVKRALRLRLVNRAWNIAVESAVFQSGILDHGNLETRVRKDADIPLWARYLTYRALHNRKPCTNRLKLVRRVVERLVEMREYNDADQSRIAVRQCIRDLFHVALVFRDTYGNIDMYLRHTLGVGDLPAELNEDCVMFKRALLTAAAYFNDTNTAHWILQKHPYIAVSPSMPITQILGPLSDPYELAAYQGHTDFILLLLSYEKGPGYDMAKRDNHHRKAIIYTAIWGNQIKTLNRALGVDFKSGTPDFRTMRGSIVSGLTHTTSDAMFKRCWNLIKDHLAFPARPYNGIFQRGWLGVRFAKAAENGAVPLMEHLAQLGAPVFGYSLDIPPEYVEPLSLAAKNGHERAVLWLLDHGAKLGRALQAAVAHGNPRIVRLLIDRGALDNKDVVKKAFLGAVKTENESCYKLIMQCDSATAYEVFQPAMQIAANEHSGSMTMLLGKSLIQKFEKLHGKGGTVAS